MALQPLPEPITQNPRRDPLPLSSDGRWEKFDKHEKEQSHISRGNQVIDQNSKPSSDRLETVRRPWLGVMGEPVHCNENNEGIDVNRFLRGLLFWIVLKPNSDSIESMVPLYDILRRCMGYKFPRLGSTAHNLFFRLVPARIETELFPGIHVHLDSRDLTQRATYWQGDRFEYPTAQNLSKWVSPSVTHFFDIGSNYGFFSYLMLSRFNRLIVHAFEPNPKTFALLEEIKQENTLTRFHPHWMGLSDVQDTLVLHPGISDSGHSTFGAHPELLSECNTGIPVDAFDHWCESVGIASHVRGSWIAKIDVEGFEFRVLKGMKESLLSKAFAGLVVEINPATLEFSGTNSQEILSFMDSVGYEETFFKQTSDKNSNSFFVPKT